MSLRKTLQNQLHNNANMARAAILRRFFKTGPGQYGEGDLFLGIPVPIQRKLAKAFYHLPLRDLAVLLKSKIHEERLIALIILVHQFEKALDSEKKSLVTFYLANTAGVNNWDLVDASTPKILGKYCLHGRRTILLKLSRSTQWWERRIGIVATLPIIKNGECQFPLKIIGRLLTDSHDLIQKANGWMLREIGKISLPTLEIFLAAKTSIIPRTTLRYAIEKLPPQKRRYYLALPK